MRLTALSLAPLLACTPAAKTDTAGLATCVIDPPAEGALSTDGPLIRDATGRAVWLRGVNAGGRSKFAPYMPFEAADFDTGLADYLDRAATWGIDVLRVPFTWAALEPVDGQWDTEWLSRYDALINGAWEREMWVIVDFHQDVYGEFYCGDGFPAWTVLDPPAPHHDCPDWFTAYLGNDEVSAAFDAFWADSTGVRSAQVQMWQALAAHFADHPGVIGYEVLNEPGWGTANRTTWAAEVVTPYYTEVAAAVHASDPDALVLFDSTGLDAVVAHTDLARPVGDNLVFAPHFYDPAILAGGDTLSVDPAVMLASWASYANDWDLPVLIGEMGVQPDFVDATAYTRAQYDALDVNQLHATWWEYSVAHELWNEERLSIVDGDGTEYAAVVDGLARPFPRAVAGTDVYWTAVDGRFDLSYTGDPGGVTEVRLPTRSATDGGWAGGDAVVVSGSGGCVDQRPDRVYVRADGGLVTLVVEG